MLLAMRRGGASVALSDDGNTALVGGPYDSNEVGAVWVFTRSGSTWRQQAKMSVSDNAGLASIGDSVSLSPDRNTAIVGGGGDDGGTGVTWAFTRTGNAWTQQGSKLTASDASTHSTFLDHADRAKDEARIFAVIQEAINLDAMGKTRGSPKDHSIRNSDRWPAR